MQIKKRSNQANKIYLAGGHILGCVFDLLYYALIDGILLCL